MSNKNANLRICMHCELVFKASEHPNGCPYCGWGTYGAHWAIGTSAYTLFKTQELWKKRLGNKLVDEILEATLKCKDVPLIEVLENETIKDLLSDLPLFNQNRN